MKCNLLLCTVMILGVANAYADQEKPNFLLVMVDDMGWTDLGSFGGEIDTPNLDTLAEQGVSFSNFHVSVSCSPTRSMLMSGTNNHIAGMGNMGELITPEQRGNPGYEGYLAERVVSLAEVLRDGGYHTYMAGKWHLGHEPEQYPHARGFDRSFSMLFGGASFWEDMHGLMAQQPVAKYVLDDKELEELPPDFYATRSYTDFLMDAIRENVGDGKPFLAYLAFTSPHDPLHVPEPWLSRYRGQYDNGYEALRERRIEAAMRLGIFPKDAPTSERHPLTRPWHSLSEEERALESRGMEVYAGMMNNTDYHYGRVIDFLKDIGEYDNTVIIFLSDNGANPWYSEDYPTNKGSEWFAQFDNSVENVGHPGSAYAYGIGWASACAGPLNMFKMAVPEGGTRTSLLIAGPGVTRGRRVDAFSYVPDIMPTILEMAGLKHPEEFQGRKVERMTGRSLSSILAGADEEPYRPDEFICGEIINGKWARRGDFKALSVAPPYGPGSWQLFNLAEDPGETRDLAKEKPELLKELVAAWDQYAENMGVILMR